MARTHLIAEQVRRIESDPALTAHLVTGVVLYVVAPAIVLLASS